MENTRLVPAALAAAGCVAVLAGVYQGLVHVAPGYEGTITSGWDGPLNHEEVLLAGLSVVGVAGAVAARRWRWLAGVPVAIGGVVLFYTLRAVAGWVQSTTPLYREFSPPAGGFEGERIMIVLGAEPFLLAAGGLLLVGAGVDRLRRRADDGNDDAAPDPAATA
jgi:hypothetical protein